MKKILLSLVILTTGYAAQSQVICAGVSPVSIAGNYEFTWADPGRGDWACPDFNIPGTFIEDTLIIVDDGTAGTNPQGNPMSAEACNPPIINDIAGKIAVIYRNTCEFGAKALAAEQAGAVGVIIVNREPEVIEMGGGVDGGSVTIPVAFISSTDGLVLTNEMLNGPVVVFLGNKTGLFADDAGVTKHTTLVSTASGVPSVLATNATDFNFDLGTRVYNYGNQDQSNITVTASIDGPSGNVYLESVSGIAIVSGDSVDVFPGGTYSFSNFGLASYELGRYTLTYSVDLGTADEYDADNYHVSEFVIGDEFALATMDQATDLPAQNNGFRPSTNTSTFSNCINFEHANGSLVTVSGLHFSAMGS